jgi:tRNA threonylcarbamoyladenosine biosynthesis protein TsaB
MFPVEPGQRHPRAREHDDDIASMTTADQQWLLAIDSSSESASLALTDSVHVAEVTWHAGRDQTATLLGEIDRLCTLLHIHPANLSAVAVAIGPGMFNGLRVGMSVAKGFVLALDLPIIGISTLDVAAYPFVGIGLPVLATVAAGRGRLVWSEYEPGNDVRQSTPPQNGTIDDLAAHALRISPCVITGELTPEHANRFRGNPGIRLLPAAARTRRASALAELAWPRFRNDDFDDAVELEPVYLHSAASTPQTEKAAIQS